MAGYLEHVRAIAAALGAIPGVRVVPDPPQTSMMYMLIATNGYRNGPRPGHGAGHLDLAERDDDRRP